MGPVSTTEERQAAVALVERLGNTPRVRAWVAQAVHRTERTLRRWVAAAHRGSLPPRRGHPPKVVARNDRQRVIHALLQLGPTTGVNVLRGLCGTVPYRQIAAIKRRFLAALTGPE